MSFLMEELGQESTKSACVYEELRKQKRYAIMLMFGARFSLTISIGIQREDIINMTALLRPLLIIYIDRDKVKAYGAN